MVAPTAPPPPPLLPRNPCPCCRFRCRNTLLLPPLCPCSSCHCHAQVHPRPCPCALSPSCPCPCTLVPPRPLILSPSPSRPRPPSPVSPSCLAAAIDNGTNVYAQTSRPWFYVGAHNTHSSLFSVLSRGQFVGTI